MKVNRNTLSEVAPTLAKQIPRFVGNVVVKLGSGGSLGRNHVGVARDRTPRIPVLLPDIREPSLDRHKNLQMVPFGGTHIDVCPVPSCGRCHDDQGYFEVVEGQLVREGKAAPNRIGEAREKILKTIRARAGA